MTLLRRLLCLLCWCLATVAWAAPAPTPTSASAPVMVEGQAFNTQLRLGASDLVLNGTGVRAVAWFKGYAVGLYVPQKAQTVEALLAQPGAKRLQLRMLQEVPPAEFAKAVRKGMERNTPEAQWPQLRDRVERFVALIMEAGTVKKGDVVDLDMDPDRGMRFSLNGTLRGDAIPGVDFNAALLRAFIGDKPYDQRMKAGLLGRPG